MEIKQNIDGQYYIYDAKYGEPISLAYKDSCFQIQSVSEELINDNTTYVITATGKFVKDGIDLGTKTISAYYNLNIDTGKIKASYE